MEFNFDNINCGSSSTSAGSGVVTASSAILSLPSYSLLHLQQQQQQSAADPFQHQHTPQLIFSTTPQLQLQQCLQQQQHLQLQPVPLDHHQLQGQGQLDQHQQHESQIPNFSDYILPDDNVPDFMNVNGGATDEHDHNHDQLPDESISLLLMPPQSPTVAKTELDKIEETIKEVGSGAYFQEQPQQQQFQTLSDLHLQSMQSKIMQNGGAGMQNSSLQASESSFEAATTQHVNNMGSEADSYADSLTSAAPPQAKEALQIHAPAPASNNGVKPEPMPVSENATAAGTTKNCTGAGTTGAKSSASTNGSGSGGAAIGTNTNSNHIGSRNSAFMPYKPITVLTNLQRGNVKTLNKEVTLTKLTVHEKAARGDLTLEDLNGLGNMDAVDAKGRTMLHWAAFHSKLQSVQILVDKGADVNFCTPKGETPLMYACANGHVEIINYLLTKAANLDLEDENGNTPIFYATIANHAPSISALLKHGASLTKPNCNGDSPFNIANARNLSAALYAMENHLRDFLEANFVIKSEKLQSNYSN